MRYYICEAQQLIEPVNSKLEKFSMNGRDTEDEAKIVYHDKMSAAMKDTNVAICVIHVMDEKGGDIVTDTYERDIPEPEPEPEPEETPEDQEPEDAEE